MEWSKWLGDNTWAAWLGLGVALGAAEMFTLDLILLMLAVGAIVGCFADLLGAPFLVQALAAMGTSAAMLLLVRPSVVKRLHAGPTLVTGPKALIGKQGVTLTEVTVHGGEVKIGYDTWLAKPYDETLVIEVGAVVDILEIKGATAYVHPLP